MLNNLTKTNAFAGSEAHGKAQVGPKKAQKSSKMAQMRPEWPTKVELGSEMANNCPRSLPDKAKTAQRGPNTAPRLPKIAQERRQRDPRWAEYGPRISQDGPKMASRWAQDGPNMAQVSPKLVARSPKMAQEAPRSQRLG